MSDQLDHPCRQTCSGWKQGYELGAAETKEARDILIQKNNQLMKQLKVGNELLEGCREENHRLWERMKSMENCLNCDNLKIVGGMLFCEETHRHNCLELCEKWQFKPSNTAQRFD